MSKMRFFALQELSNRKPLEVIAPSNKLSDYYGSHVFDRKKMQEYLPKEAYKAVNAAIWFFVQQYIEVMLACDTLHQVHDKLVVVVCQIAVFEDGSQVELVGS